MSDKHEKLLSLPGVVGFGYGTKEINGRLTETEAIIVFVEKKIPREELKDEEFIPAAINDTPTDVIEIGEVFAYDQPDKKNNGFRELLDILERDLEKFLVIKKSKQRLMKAQQFVIKSLRNLSTDLSIKCKVQEKIEIFKKNLSLFTNINKKINRTSLVRPAMPGVSIGHFQGFAGTFGAVVYDRVNNKPLILSNNHVLANTSLANNHKAKINDPIVQPAKIDGNSKVIGKLARFTILNLYPQPNIVDCAVAKPVNVKYISPEILDIGKINGVTDPVIGLKIKKSGRTTGITSGEVRAVKATIKVNYGNGIILKFENQIIASKMSEPGDSGSLVVDKDNKAVGLLFAGSKQSTIINPIGPVLDFLEVKF
jgi:hypothetical protein